MSPAPSPTARAATWLARLGPRRAAAAAAALGLLGALALPPVHAVPVLLLAVPGLLVLVGAARSGRRAALLGLAWGWGHHLGGLYWITHAVLTEAERYWWLVPVAVPALALPLGAFAALPAWAAWRAAPGGPRVAAFAGAFVLAELLRGVLFTGFPWNLLGSAWAFAALPVQPAAWVGAHGLSLLTALLAGLPLVAARRVRAGAALGVALLAALSAWRLAGPEPAPPGVALLLVQGNVAQEAKWREDQRLPIFRRYLDLTRDGLAALPPGPRPVAVWPETASPFLLADDPAARAAAAAVLPPGGLLLAGTVRGTWDATGRMEAVFNSLVALDAAGAVRAAYDKAHLVPFGEYMPLRGLLPVRLVHGALDFSAGPGPRALAPDGLPPFGALICYEVIFPARVAPSPRPDWLLNVTNDAWFGRSAGPHQHLAAARLRAVEEGLPLARAAQTGISALFDARGRERGRLGLGETGTLAAALPGPLPPTPFARLGTWLPAALSTLALVLGLGSSRRSGSAVAKKLRSSMNLGRFSKRLTKGKRCLNDSA